MNQLVLGFVLVALSVLATSACKTVRAETPVERPNLEVPPPPARIIEPRVTEPPATEPTGETPAAPAGTTKPRPQTTAPPKPEVKPETPVEPAPTTTTPPPPPPTTPPELRTPGMSSGAEAFRQIRAALDRTASLLRGTNYQTLSTERKNSYDTARRFMEEGEKELKATNYVLAKELADKAERLAKELQGR